LIAAAVLGAALYCNSLPGGDVTITVLTKRGCLLYTIVVCASAQLSKAQTKQLLTPEACTGIRYVAQGRETARSRIQLSPDGLKVAYVLQVPDVASNDNQEELYVAALEPQSPQSPLPVFVNPLVAAPRWFPDSRHLAVLLRHGQKIALAEIDSVTHSKEVIWEADADITDYSMDDAGKTIAVGVRTMAHAESESEVSHDGQKGYRLDRVAIAHSRSPRRKVYILRLTAEHGWKVSEPIKFVSPLSGRAIEDIVDNHALPISISPNGHLLLLDNFESYSDVPQSNGWQQSALVQYIRNGGGGLYVSYLYDIDTGHATMPLRSPYVLGGLWAPDSRSYVQLALAPAASEWERSDLEKDTPNAHINHLFAVEVNSGRVSEVLRRAEEVPLAWTRAGDIVVRSPTGTMTSLRAISDQWEPIDTRNILPTGGAPYGSFVSDGERVVMEYQNAGTPPEIAAFDFKSRRTWTVAKLNPEVEGLALPKTELLTWTTSTGYKANGLLLLPPDYDPDRRYPLVIENGSVLYNGNFVCDSGIGHEPSFARGILADAGVIYLMRNWPGVDDWKSNYYPKGYPGGVAEAAFQQDLAESAVKILDERRMIDPAKVGLIGFSRGGWYVEYMLAHSHIPFQAASAFDNVLYSLGEYWYLNNEGTARQWDSMYGGPPYGKSLKNWLDYSISFNLDKFHAPLLMEVMGYGKKYDNPDAPPDNVAMHNEVFVGLTQLHKPVEYYYYPNEEHQPEHPQARIASLQRNVDWFRFWLQGYERPDPQDPDQYKRWERLRAQQVADRENQGSSPVEAQWH
jgi:dipeptidyl aminopeptidase/acylaminoacyl peptidase